MRLLSLLVLVALAAVAVRAHSQPHEADDWQHRANMPFARSDFTAVTVDDNVYVLGGCSSDQLVNGNCVSVTNQFTSYAIEDDAWIVHTAAPSNRTRYQVAHVDGKLYYIGGRDVTEAIVEGIDVYTIATDSWTTVEPTSEGHLRSDGAAWVNNGTIFLTGGYTPNYAAFASTVGASIANLADGFVTGLVADKPVASGDIGLVGPIDGKVYSFGGFTDDFCKPVKTVDVYDIATNTWSAGTPFLTARADSAYASLGSKIYIIGGETKTSACVDAPHTKSVPVDNVEVFDTKNPSAGWVVLDDIALDRMRFSAAAHEHTNTLYNLGGQGSQTGTSAPNIADPANLDGYYPVLHEVYSLDVEAVTVSAAANVQAGGVFSLATVVAAVVLALRC